MRAFGFAVNEIQAKHSELSEEIKGAISVLTSILHAQELRAYHDLFMFGNFIDEATRQEIKQMALKRFFNEDSAIAGFLKMNPDSMLGWLSEDEEEFRKEMRGEMKS